MRVVIAGGGSVSFYAAKQLAGEGHNVVVICQDARQATTFAERLQVVALHGDPTTPSVLVDAGVGEAHVFVALAEADQTNLVSCKLARAAGVQRVVALLNAPENRTLFERLGFTDVISAAEVLGALVRHESSFKGLMAQLSLRGGILGLLELELPADAPCAGRCIAELDLPPETLIVAVVRGDRAMIAHGGVLLHANDEVLVACRTAHRDQVLQTLLGAPK